MSVLNDKLNKVLEAIYDVGNYDKGVETILIDGFALSLRTIEEVAKKDPEVKTVDVNKQIEMVTNALGFSIEDIIIQAISNNSNMNMQQNQQYPTGTFDPNKVADDDTLNFIIGNADTEKSVKTTKTQDNNVDDYEIFLSKAKENLDFLKTQI